MRAPKVEPGLILDGFTLEEKIKRGGMAELWRVTKPGEAAPLVMKIPLILDGDDPTMIVGFEMEQMILPRIKGPHVPRFLANGDFAVQPFVVMEWIEGRSLYEQTADFPLPIPEVTRIGQAVARALDSLHCQRVLHLDVKPANVLIRPAGTAVLIDFGLARHLDLPDLLAEEFRMPMGTAAYIAPEQLLKQRDEPRSDVFALGAVLYEMITGRQPFGNPRGSGALRKRLWSDPLPPRALRPDCPAWLQDIVLRCLAIDPRERFPTACQLAFALGHPESVPAGPRGEKIARDPFGQRVKRWLRTAGAERQAAETPTTRVGETPIVVVAVDLCEDYSDIAEHVREMARAMLRFLPDARLACINVLKTKRIGIDDMVDAEGRALHVSRLVTLRGWAAPLKLDMERVSFHVLESPDPASAIVAYARDNGVDQIIMGARASSTKRRYLGSVSAQVAAEAPCTVTIVRMRAGAEAS